MNDEFPDVRIDVRRSAFFFDVDGTLAEIQTRPEAVHIAEGILDSLARLHRLCPAVAIVSGRPIEQLDRLLHPLKLAAAGIHGAEWRTPGGEWQHLELQQELLTHVRDELADACDDCPGLRLENKGMAFALHYRGAPDLKETAHALARQVASHHEDSFTLQPGKCVFELKPKGASKGEAIQRFMTDAPFKGRMPVFLGDDLTDEAGFVVVNRLRGLSIKVGEGHSAAQARLASVGAVGQWLATLLAHAEAEEEPNDVSRTAGTGFSKQIETHGDRQ